MTRVRALIVVTALLAIGCDAKRLLLVDVVSDHPPGAVERIEVELLRDSASIDQRVHVDGGDFPLGVRVAEFDGLAGGDYAVEVRLMAGDTVVAAQRQSVVLATSFGMTFTFACGSVAETCNGVDDDCDGTIDEDPDRALCEADESAGVMSTACVEGACTIAACAGWFADCNGDPNDGCEADTAASVEHCGASGAIR